MDLISALQRCSCNGLATRFATLHGWGRTPEGRLTPVASGVALALQDATVCNAARNTLRARVTCARCSPVRESTNVSGEEVRKEKEILKKKKSDDGLVLISFLGLER